MNAPVIACSHTPLEQLSIFRQAATRFASTLDLEQTLANAIDVFLPALGDFGFFDAVVDGAVRRTARAHLDGATETILATTGWQRQEAGELNLCALSSGQAALHTGIDDEWYQRVALGEGHLALLRTLGFSAMLTVPVSSGGQLLGALTLFMAASGRTYTEGDLAFAAELAALAAPVVANARLLEKERLSELALRSSEERLRLALDAGQIGIWDWDVVSDSVSWSPRVYDLHGLAPGQFGGKVADFSALVHPDDRMRLRADMAAVLHEGDLFTAEFRILRPDGRLAWLTTWARPYREPGQGATRMVGATMDVTNQKQMLAQLEEVNSLLEQRVASSNTERDRIWNMSRDILAVVSQQGYLVSVNPAFAEVLGWSEAQALATPFMELVEPSQRCEAALLLARLAEGSPVEDFNVKVRHRDGGQRWLSWTLVPAGDRFYGIGRDVTEFHRQRAQREQASKTRLQLALDVGGMGAWQLDVGSSTLQLWPGMDVLHGLEPGTASIAMDDYMALIHPDDRERAATSLADDLRAKHGRLIEYRIVRPDGSVRWVEGRGELALDEHGEPFQFSGICVDITKRKRTEEDLRFVAQASAELASLGELRTTLETVAQLAVPGFADWCAVDLLDPAGTLERIAVAHIDPAKVALAHELSQRYPPDENAASGAWQVIRSGATETVAKIEDALLVASAVDAEHLCILRELGLHSYIAAPLAVRGKTLGVISFIAAEGCRSYAPDDVALAEDIARRVAIAVENANLYRTLQAADRRKDEFLAMLAHELRNPLAPIRAAADLLKLSSAEPRLAKVSEVITRQVGHMTELVDDLLDVSRVTRGHVELDRHPVDMKAVAAAAIEQVRPLIEARGHALATVVAPEALTVEGDEKRLVQIAANLLNNAAKYTPPGGHLELQLASAGAQVVLTVRDDGIGMPPDLVAGAFELFAQAARSSDRSQGGLGLGLALVRSLVELHGGKVRAFSKGAGCGSQFVVELARLQPADSQLLAPGTEGGGTGAAACHGLQVLVVDDNVDAASMLAMFLEMGGHSVTVCHDPLEALAKAAAQRFDVGLLDIGLPGMDGNELARRIRSGGGPHRPALIAVSGYGQAHDRDKALQAGFDHYLVKPVATLSLQDLLSRIGTQRLAHN